MFALAVASRSWLGGGGGGGSGRRGEWEEGGMGGIGQYIFSIRKQHTVNKGTRV